MAPAQAVKRPATPGRIDGLAKATRAIVVHSWSSKSTRPVLRSYQRARPGDRWRPVRGPMPARIGDNGFWVTRPCADGGSLWKNRRVAYQHAAVIDLNYRRPGCKKGSGIFLHQQTGGPAAGCVSLRHKDLAALLRWLRPGTRIAMGPAGYLNNRL